MNSEKYTDYKLTSIWKTIFNTEYNTNGNSELFGRLIPDGWFEYTNSNNQKYLFIIENKKDYTLLKSGFIQLLKYYNCIKSKSNYNQIYLILGLGNNETNFIYKVFVTSPKINNYNHTLEYIKEEMEYKTSFNDKDIHDFNQYMYNNGINLTKSQKTLFVASILLTLKIDPKIINRYDPENPGFMIANKMLELIQNSYNDETFTNQFIFLKKSLKNKWLYDLIQKIYIDYSKYGKDILNMFYSEFCKYDKNNDSSLGVVLTPDDIIKLMVDNLNIKETDTLLDFCTGTGSFLLEGSKYTSHLIGCEYNEERYALAKCNFILNDLDYSKLYYNSCFSINFDKVDKSIINPPFSTNSSDLNLIENNETNWKLYNNEQKFLLYQVQCLKIGGLGACIIPRSNFNNTIKKTTEFKAELMKHVIINKIINCNSKIFAPVANVECAIIIYTRVKSTDNPQVSKDVTIIDYTNDGYDIKKNIRIKISEPSINEQIRDLDYKSDFNYIKEFNPPEDIIKMINIYNINYSSSIYKNKLVTYDNIDISNLNKEKFKLYDLFEILKIDYYQTDKSDIGNIPLYGATQLNDPVKFINKYSIDTSKSEDPLIRRYGVFCINKTGNGGAGISYIRFGKFAVNPSIYCCKMKMYISLTNAAFISYQLHDKFNRSNSLNLTKFMDTEVYMFDDDIKLYDEFNIIKYIDTNNHLEKYDYLKIGDYFNLLPPGKIDGNKNNTNIGKYSLISTGQQNHGLLKYVDTYEYDGESNNYLTIAMYGSTGSCFYQKCKFIVNHNVRVLEPKSDSTDCHIWAMMINYCLTQKYSYSRGLSINKLLNEIIPIPVFKKNE